METEETTEGPSLHAEGSNTISKMVGPKPLPCSDELAEGAAEGATEEATEEITMMTEDWIFSLLMIEGEADGKTADGEADGKTVDGEAEGTTVDGEPGGMTVDGDGTDVGALEMMEETAPPKTTVAVSTGAPGVVQTPVGKMAMTEVAGVGTPVEGDAVGTTKDDEITGLK